MICQYCGKENQDHVDICDYCGASLSQKAEAKITQSPISEPGSEVEETAKINTVEEQNVDHPTEMEQPTVQPKSFDAGIGQPPQPASGIYGNKFWWLAGGCAFLFALVMCAAAGWGAYQFSMGMAFFNPPTPTATTAPAPTAEPTAMPELLFFDDFSDPNSGWDRVDEADFYTDYYNGAYRIKVYLEKYDNWANPGDNIFTDVSIEVDTTKNGGPDDNDFGVICRYQDPNKFYYAMISSDGYYGITKVVGDSSELLGHEELQPSDAIKQGESLNHIRFDCVGSQLSLYVNGQLIDQQEDSEYSYGNVGLIAGTYDIPGTDILFDNFSVRQP